MGNTYQKPILVIGATGYIASHTIQYLLQKGFKVKATTRSLQNISKLQFLKQFKPPQNLQIIEAQLTNQQCWDRIVAGSDYVLHIASPFQINIPKNQDQIINPIINSAKFVLNACIRQKVKRFIYTTSCLNSIFGNQNQKMINQTMWANLSNSSAYIKSRCIAQRLIWKIYNDQNLKQQHTEVVSLLVGTVFGPGISIHKNISEYILLQIMKGRNPFLVDKKRLIPVVDVRDVGTALIKCILKNSLQGERIMIVSRVIQLYDIFRLIKQNFVKELVIEIQENGIGIKQLGQVRGDIIENGKSKKILDMQYRDINKSIIQMGNQLIKLNLIHLQN